MDNNRATIYQDILVLQETGHIGYKAAYCNKSKFLTLKTMKPYGLIHTAELELTQSLLTVKSNYALHNSPKLTNLLHRCTNCSPNMFFTASNFAERLRNKGNERGRDDNRI